MIFRMRITKASNIRGEDFKIPEIIRNAVIVVTAPNFKKAKEDAQKQLEEFFPTEESRGRLGELHLGFNILEIEL